MSDSDNRRLLHPATRRVVIAIGLGTAAIILLYLLQSAIQVLLLLFAGLLLALLLNGISGWLEKRTRLPRPVALGLVILLLLTAIILLGWLATPNLIRQTQQLSRSLADSWQQIVDYLEQYVWGQQLIEQLRVTPERVAAQGPSILTGISGIFSSTLDVLINFAILIFTGFFLAVNPKIYRDGLVQLVPKRQRPKARELLQVLARTLRWWLAGRLASMAIVGILTTLGLMLLDVPLALILGFLAGLLSFVPIVGPVVSVVPTVLVAAGNSIEQVIYVLLLYQGIQIIESYLLTPVIQERAVSLPPVVTIISQVLAGLVAGPLGVALAQPLAAVSMVLVKFLYVEEILEDYTVRVDPTPS
jgi:predicted PurR-regulated permease PerM